MTHLEAFEVLERTIIPSQDTCDSKPRLAASPMSSRAAGSIVILMKLNAMEKKKERKKTGRKWHSVMDIHEGRALPNLKENKFRVLAALIHVREHFYPNCYSSERGVKTLQVCPDTLIWGGCDLS